MRGGEVSGRASGRKIEARPRFCSIWPSDCSLLRTASARSATRDALDAAILADAAAVGAEQAAAAEPAPRRRGRRGAIDGGCLWGCVVG